METKNLDKYNYQIVFKLSDSDRIIFSGQTELDVIALIEQCVANLDLLSGYEIENLIYQIIKNEENHES